MFGIPEADRLIQQAEVLRGNGDRDGAERLLQQALALDPDHLLAATRLGEIAVDRKDPARAMDLLRPVLVREPAFAPAWGALAHAAWVSGDPRTGLRHARRAMEIQPQNPHLRLLLAQFLVWLDRHREVPHLLAPLLEADQPVPAIRARAMSMMGEMHVAAGNEAAADDWFRAALALVPGLVATRLALGMNRLRQGDYEEGLREYEIRAQVTFFHPAGPPTRPGKPWRGEDLRGRSILIEDEQGFGDAVNFFRYIRLLRARGAARIVLQTYPPLVPLFRASDPALQIVDARPADFTPDFHCFSASLPHAFETRVATIPAEIPYLTAPALRTRPHLRLPPTERKRVGIVWSGDPRHLRDHFRSVPAARFLTLTDRADLEFVSLQASVREEDRAALTARPAIWRLGDQLRDYGDTAAVIAQLDLVIGVDTSVVHVAGALGRPVWILLPLSPDWRWILGRDDTPWYPTARLFRCDRRGWGPVLRRVAAALDAFVASA